MRGWAIAPLLALAACASAPTKIPAAYQDDTPWRGMTCDELRAEELRIGRASGGATNVQQLLHGSIAGLPLAVASGNAAQNRIAVYKGQLEAVARVLAAKNCPSPLPPFPDAQN